VGNADTPSAYTNQNFVPALAQKAEKLRQEFVRQTLRDMNSYLDALLEEYNKANPDKPAFTVTSGAFSVVTSNGPGLPNSEVVLTEAEIRQWQHAIEHEHARVRPSARPQGHASSAQLRSVLASNWISYGGRRAWRSHVGWSQRLQGPVSETSLLTMQDTVSDAVNTFISAPVTESAHRRPSPRMPDRSPTPGDSTGDGPSPRGAATANPRNEPSPKVTDPRSE